MKELTTELVHSQLSNKQKLLVNDTTMKEIQKLSEDPEYGPEFLDTYLDHLQVLKENPNRTPDQYLSAIKFYSLVMADHSLTDAYVKTFPDRFTERTKGYVPSDEYPTAKSVLRSEASRYNKSMMVNKIRDVAGIPVQLIYRHTLHEAILVQAELMRTAKSEMVRQKASATLIQELKPQEDQVIQVEVEDNSTSVIEELVKATKALAAEQHRSVMAGVPLKEISAARLQERSEPIDGEFTRE
jgi:hypothetical protein